MSTITVATLNIFNRMGQWGLRAPLLIDQLEQLAPDVIGLQEVDLVLDQGMWVSRQINKRMAEQPHYRMKHATSPGQRASFLSIATLAKLEFLEHEVLDFMSFERMAQRMAFDAGGQRFIFVNTHLHHPTDAVQERVEQTERLLAWLDRDARGLPAVVAGDFNARPDEPTVAMMKQRFRSAHEAVHGREPDKTWPTPVNTFDPDPPGTLDYIFVSPELRIVDAGLAFDKPGALDKDLYPSDHLGLFARLEV